MVFCFFSSLQFIVMFIYFELYCLIWPVRIPSSWLLYPPDIFFQCFHVFWHNKIFHSHVVLYFHPSAMKWDIFPRNPRMVFRSQHLGAKSTHCCWWVTISSTSTEQNPAIHICIHMVHSQLYLYLFPYLSHIHWKPWVHTCSFFFF